MVGVFVTGCGGPSLHERVCDELRRALSATAPDEAYALFLGAQQMALDLRDSDPLKESVASAGDDQGVSPFAVMNIVDDHCKARALA